MNTPNVSEIAQALRGSDFPSRFSADESRLLIKVLRLVAEGRPVTPGRVEQAAAHLELPLGAATSFLRKLSESLPSSLMSPGSVSVDVMDPVML